MDSFEIFFEKVKNPLRKKRLQRRKYRLDNLEAFNNKIEEIKEDPTFKKMSEKFPERASKYIEKKKTELAPFYLKPKLNPNDHVVVKLQGFDVFFDKSLPFTDNPTEFAKVKRRLNSTIYSAKNVYLKGLLPIRKPKIVVSDLSSFEDIAFRSDQSLSGFYRDGVIYIDEYSVHDTDTFVHEYSHFLADRVKSQTQTALRKAYNNMLDAYYNELNKKRIDLKDKRTDSPKTSAKKLQEREAIAQKLGFPSEYGLNDFDEFFAELMVNWKSMPLNAITYRFKKSVKEIINRL